jgi:hemerythrin
MGKMRWQNSLSVGIDLIDNQHKQWIQYYNDTVEAVATQKSQAQVMKTLGFLIDYTGTHFATEEHHMAESKYPAMAEHKAKHDELRSTLAGLVKDFEEEGVTLELNKALETFLGNWLIQHIHEIDRKFGAYAKQEKIVIS